ncbi:thyrotropin-releasing hormone receptor [Biomphalaria pfeifferi]|uniref:Thyrotropin-releasing hormone receptor n=1 Tax=Biomphalaria pfeifferi TaxID=112525 RepID=A0AAD8BCY2_BIOPF|nr:thyrotropin-releasing hormone receptor [Biomphalaria pfeifferi]
MLNTSFCTKDTNQTIYELDTEVELISDHARSAVLFFIHVMLDMCICVFGIAGNCLNITVFLRQGLRKSVNLSLFAMSLSDLIGLIFQVWHNFCMNPYLALADLPVDFMDLQELTAGYPNVAMTRITSWITMYITAERCLSVLTPFRVGILVTFERSLVILILCYSINLAFLVPQYAFDYFSYSFIPGLNKTILGISVRWNDELLVYVLNISHINLSTISIVFVIMNTAILVVSLSWKSKWRHSAMSNQIQQKALSSRDKKIVMLVIMVATVLIVCYSPAVTCTFLEIFLPSFGFYAKQKNVYHVAWSFCFLFNSINASINVIVYYKMSSNYRTTLQEMFPRLKSKIKKV